MNLRRAARGGLALGLLAGTLGCASVPPEVFRLESRFSDLSARSCRPESGSTSIEEPAMRCPGLGGAEVVLGARDGRATLGFEWPPAGKARDVVSAPSFGPKFEWRGYGARRHFEPYAGIVRAFVKGDSDAEGHPILAVLRIRPNDTCLVGAVDTFANPQAEEAARQLADAYAPGFACGIATPRIAGQPTERVKSFLAGF
jgi:hypothetical protein